MATFTKRKYAFVLSWPPALVLLIFLAAGELLGGRYRVFSDSAAVFLAAFAIVLLAAIAYAENHLRSQYATIAVVFLVSYITILDVVSIGHLLRILVSGVPGIRGGQLLGSSLYFWSCNVLTFGLWFWLIDRGGPHERAHGSNGRVEFLFPEMTAGDTAANWRGPDFIEYMYLAYTNATAFSPTDTLPLSSRARILMGIESTLSLATIALVTARAVNILS